MKDRCSGQLLLMTHSALLESDGSQSQSIDLHTQIVGYRSQSFGFHALVQLGLVFNAEYDGIHTEDIKGVAMRHNCRVDVEIGTEYAERLGADLEV